MRFLLLLLVLYVVACCVLIAMAGISACASFPVVAVDSALRPEAVEGQGAAATAPKTVTESESSASASMEPEEQVEEPAKKRKRDPAPDVGSSSMDGTDGQGSDDDKNDDGEEAPVLQAVSPPRQNALQRLVDECRVLLDGSSKSTQPPNSTTVSRIVALLSTWLRAPILISFLDRCIYFKI